VEILRALAVLAEKPVKETAEIARSIGLSVEPSSLEFTELFSFQLYPYASVYLGEAGHIGGDAQDTVAGFWRVLGGEPPKEPDHLAALLALYAGLTDALEAETSPGKREALLRARSALLCEHLLSWLPPFLLKCAEIAAPPYDEWASILTDALRLEAHTAGVGECRPVIFGSRSACPDPRETGFEEFAAGIVAPARSGFILTGIDLKRCAGETGTGTRIGERTFLLKSLMGQDASGVLDWLSGEAMRASANYDQWLGDAPFVIQSWKTQAEQTSKLCSSLASDLDLPPVE